MSQRTRPSLTPIQSVLGRRSRAPESSISAALPVGANVQPPKKRLDAGWGALRESLKIVERCSDMCLPLKAAVGGLLGVLEYVEKIQDAHEELIAIASKIEALSGVLTRYANGVPPHIGQRLEGLAKAINGYTAMIEAKKQRGLLRRIIEASGDGQDIVRAFRDISFLVDVFTMQTSLSTENAVNQAARDALLDKLHHVPDAEFNRGDRTACMEGTREALLDDIVAWALDRDSHSVFWLDGMAGTGKTTIAESLCRILNSKGILAGSFFCWRTGSAARRSARRIFPSLAVSCSRTFPALAESLTDLLAKERDAVAFSLAPQFEILFEKPLQRAFSSDMPKPVLVIDALDECEDAKATSTLIDIILKKAASHHVKFFLTSRPEAHIRAKFADPQSPLHSVLRLHDIEKSVISADIECYFCQRLGTIPGLILDYRRLKDLVHRANGLFIYAFTICEYITSVAGDPQSRLNNLLIGQRPSRKAGQQLDNHYAFIMNDALNQHDETETADMKSVLCCIIFGREKFTISGAARLVGISNSRVRTSLSSLHSVLHVPSEKAVAEDYDFMDRLRVKDGDDFIRVNHASFSDYLTDSSRSGGESWFLDACYAHEYLLTRCLDMLNFRLCLNVSCSVYSYKESLPSSRPSLDSALTYAARFWTVHFSMLLSPQLRSHDVLGFLRTKFLYWLDISFDDKWKVVRESLRWVLRIQNLDRKLVEFIRMGLDMLDFITSDEYLGYDKRNSGSQFLPGREHIYLSVLPSLPDSCGIKKAFRPRFQNTVIFCDSMIPPRVQTPIISDGVLKSPESELICSMAVAADGRFIVSGSTNGRIRLWDAHTGHPICAPVQCHSRAVECLAFSPDGTMLCSGTPDKTLRMWDSHSIKPLGPVLIRSEWNNFFATSRDGKKIACPTVSHAIEIIDVDEGETSGPLLVGHTNSVTCIAFCSQTDRVISGSDDGTLRIWILHAEEVLSASLEGHTSAVTSVAVSLDGHMLASGSLDCSIRIWDTHTHRPQGVIEGHTGPVYAVTFSTQRTLVISGSEDRTVRVWDVGTGSPFCEPLEGHVRAITSVAVTKDDRTIVSQSKDGTIRLWDAPIEMVDSFRATHEIRSGVSIDGMSLLSWPFQLQVGPDWSRQLDEGYILNTQGEIILWVPYHARHRLMTPRTRLILGAEAIYLDFSRFKYGPSWTECYTPNEDDQLGTIPSEIEGLPVYGPRHFEIDLDSEC